MTTGEFIQRQVASIRSGFGLSQIRDEVYRYVFRENVGILRIDAMIDLCMELYLAIIQESEKQTIETKSLRIVLDKIQTCIELQNGATESQLKDLWNDISSAITEIEAGSETKLNKAATDLLEALIKAKEFIDELSDDGIEPSDEELMKDINEAIKKATK